MSESLLAHAPADRAVTVGQLLRWGAETLCGVSNSPRLDAELLLAHATGARRSEIYAFPERAVMPSAQHVYAQLIARRRDDVPTAYLLGVREFYSLELVVGPEVLVPRPETELVVDAALALLGDSARTEVIDLGTGSGAIALALKHERPASRITAVDSSAAAIELARRNASDLGLDVEFVLSDWFGRVAGRRFDLAVANPPYIVSTDPVLRSTLRHEPVEALDGGADGLDSIRALVSAAARHLRRSGMLIVEHGDTQAAAVRELASEQGFVDVRTLRDLAGRDRVLVARRP